MVVRSNSCQLLTVTVFISCFLGLASDWRLLEIPRLVLLDRSATNRTAFVDMCTIPSMKPGYHPGYVESGVSAVSAIETSVQKMELVYFCGLF
jgi:hypothetical protein